MSVVPAFADEPTPLWTKRWTAAETATYKFLVSEDSTQTPVPTWLQQVMNNVLQTTWADSQTNNSNGVRFTPGSTNPDIVVRYSPHIAQTEFCGDGWLGCADPTVVPKKIYIRKGPAGYLSWCDITFQAGCPDGGRAAIHEVGHVGDLGHNTTYGTWAQTRMTSPSFPFNDTNTWDRRTLGRCDEAALQLRYDLEDKAGGYANCFDHITNHGAQGLVTDLSAAPANTTVCASVSVTVSGRLQVHDYTSYGALAKNGIWARTVWIDRGSIAKYTYATTVSGGGNNWSKSFTGSNVTFNYVAHYDRPTGEGLDSSPDRAFTITWLSPQVQC